MALTSQNIEAELSYAYLHAVAAMAGMSCQIAERHLDNAGVDATVHASEQFAVDSVFTDISLHVQLKATVATPAISEGKLSYWMSDVRRYDKLRTSRTMPPRVLVVLFLPVSAKDWLHWTEEKLALQRCAYWASLRGAVASTNGTGQTIYIPQANVFSPDGLRKLVTRLSRNEILSYGN